MSNRTKINYSPQKQTSEVEPAGAGGSQDTSDIGPPRRVQLPMSIFVAPLCWQISVAVEFNLRPVQFDIHLFCLKPAQLAFYFYTCKNKCVKKILPVCFLFMLSIWVNSCKKCYTCTNTCQQCTYRDSGVVVIQFTLCRDSFASDQQFQAAISADSALGYFCTATTPTYNESFCSNKPGEAYFPSYYNRGGRVTCVEQ
jgi:hypothetical protein